MTSLEHQAITANGLRLHYASAGPERGKPVILLHGFPEFWYSWRKQIPALAEAGLRVIAPDQRGYNLSEKPRDIAAYNLDTLAADVIGLADALAAGRFSLVGHDWGAAVAWWVAHTFPDRLEKLAIINVPHPGVYLRYVRRHPTQWLKSWYILFFQFPAVAEWAISRSQGRILFNMMIHTSRPGAFTAEDRELYLAAWNQPGALTSMIHWYRAAVQHPPKPTPPGKVRVPALIVWGRHDVALNWQLAQLSADICEQSRVVMFDDSTHWVHHEQADQVNALLIEHLT